MTTHGSTPDEVARLTQDVNDVAGDAADQAERLSMIMEAEAIRSGLRGSGDGEGSLDGFLYPLEDTEDLIAAEDADDASDDPMHAGGMNPAPYVPAEQAAMHIVNDNDLGDDYVADLEEDDDADVDPFDRPGSELTPEDETLLGVDPYEG